MELPKISALAIPVLLEVGKESIMSEAVETMLKELEIDLIKEIRKN